MLSDFHGYNVYNSDQQKYMLNTAKIHDYKTTSIPGINDLFESKCQTKLIKIGEYFSINTSSFKTPASLPLHILVYRFSSCGPTFQISFKHLI